MLGIAIVGPLADIPQIYRILKFKTVEGISTLTYVFYFCLSAMWLVYGITHKDKPLIISSAMWMIMESVILYSLGYYA